MHHGLKGIDVSAWVTDVAVAFLRLTMSAWATLHGNWRQEWLAKAGTCMAASGATYMDVTATSEARDGLVARNGTSNFSPPSLPCRRACPWHRRPACYVSGV